MATTSIVKAAAISRRSLDRFFSESTLRYPDRPALFASGQYWSYKQLDAECRAIETALHAAKLAGSDCNVGVIYARGMFSYAAVIAIMRSDNVYVPLNRKMPAERLAKILEDAGIEAVIIDSSEEPSESVIDALRKSKPLQIIVQETDSSSFLKSVVKDATQHCLWRAPHPNVALTQTNGIQKDVPLNSARLAYIIYTSGSTGTPKGVAITHESACSCIEKLHRMFGTCEQDRFTQFSALSFDVSIADLFLCWKSGATLYVPAHSEALVPLNFAVTHKITVWSSVPSLASFLFKLQLLKSDALSCIRLTLFAGEALPIDLTKAWLNAARRSRIFNLYGPTECTIFSTYYEYDSQSSPQHGVCPIGIPLPGLSCMIVDGGSAVEVDNEPGELWLAGDQLAVEYWKNPVATQAAFVRHQFGDMTAEVWYRTGDLVSNRSGVGLSFRGRLDRQIKLRGFRIELQEIESALRDVIGCAIVAVVPLGNAGGICEKIIAYCDALNADEASIKARCLSRIAPYMVPERILELDTFPLGDSGKIDYLALAARSIAQSD